MTSSAIAGPTAPSPSEGSARRPGRGESAVRAVGRDRRGATGGRSGGTPAAAGHRSLRTRGAMARSGCAGDRVSPDPRDLDAVRRRPGTAGDDAPRRSRARPLLALGRQPAGPDLDADEILDELSNDVMAEGDLAEALRRLMERAGAAATRPGPTCPGCRTSWIGSAVAARSCASGSSSATSSATSGASSKRSCRRSGPGSKRRLERSSGGRPTRRTRRLRRRCRPAAPPTRRPRPPEAAPRRRREAARPAGRPAARRRRRIRDLREYDFLEPDARDPFR